MDFRKHTGETTQSSRGEFYLSQKSIIYQKVFLWPLTACSLELLFFCGLCYFGTDSEHSIGHCCLESAVVTPTLRVLWCVLGQISFFFSSQSNFLIEDCFTSYFDVHLKVRNGAAGLRSGRWLNLCRCLTKFDQTAVAVCWCHFSSHRSCTHVVVCSKQPHIICLFVINRWTLLDKRYFMFCSFGLFQLIVSVVQPNCTMDKLYVQWTGIVSVTFRKWKGKTGSQKTRQHLSPCDFPLQDDPGALRGAGGVHLPDHRLPGGEWPGQLLLLRGERQRAETG